MELRHLRYFLAIAEHKSIRLASEHIHVTQPALSRQIQALEAELGFELFERSPRGLTLTVAGETYMTDIVRVMSDLETAARQAKRISTGHTGHLRLGFVENCSWDGIVPKALRAFQLSTSGVSLELNPLNTPDQLTRLGDGALEGGFVYQYHDFPDDLKVIPIANNGVALAVPVSWNAERDETSLQAFAEKPFITFPRWVYPAYYDRLMAACVALGVSLNVVQEEQTESAILALVGSGIGAALVNSANLGRRPASVNFLRLTDFPLAMPLVFAYRRDNRSPLLHRFVETVHRALAEEDEDEGGDVGDAL
jgi:DNA-binding transcriptional LysR family regulator